MLSLQLFQMAAQIFIYNKELTSGILGEYIASIVFQFLNLLAMHLVINIVGQLFVEAEILRAGDE